MEQHLNSLRAGYFHICDDSVDSSGTDGAFSLTPPNSELMAVIIGVEIQGTGSTCNMEGGKVGECGNVENA